GEHRHAAHAAIRLERVQVNVQERRSGGLHAVHERLLDVLEVIEPLGLVEVDDQMRARAFHPIDLDEMVRGLLPLPSCSVWAKLFCLLGGYQMTCAHP